MEKSDLLQFSDEVRVSILGPDDRLLYETTSTGHHNLESAITDAIEKGKININPEDCVFTVSNLTTGVSHKYRFNAHNNLKLINWKKPLAFTPGC